MNNIFSWSVGFDKSKNGCHNICDSRSWERKTGLGPRAPNLAKVMLYQLSYFRKRLRVALPLFCSVE